MMGILGWNLMGLMVGTGLIFTTDFNTLRGNLWKALGCVMVMSSTYHLAGLLG